MLETIIYSLLAWINDRLFSATPTTWWLSSVLTCFGFYLNITHTGGTRWARSWAVHRAVRAGILGDPESKAELCSLVVRMLCVSTRQDSLVSIPGVYRKKDLDKHLILRIKPNNKTAAVVAGSNATRDVHIGQLPEIPEVTTQCIWFKKW